jgi:hypothetical protein
VKLLDAVRSWAQELSADRLRIGALTANTEGCTFWEQQQAKPFSITYTIDLEGGGSQEGAVKPKGRLGF